MPSTIDLVIRESVFHRPERSGFELEVICTLSFPNGCQVEIAAVGRICRIMLAERRRILPERHNSATERPALFVTELQCGRMPSQRSQTKSGAIPE